MDYVGELLCKNNLSLSLLLSSSLSSSIHALVSFSFENNVTKSQYIANGKQ